MVSEARKQSMAWMETDYSKHTYFRWKVKWRLEYLGALGIMGDTAPLNVSLLLTYKEGTVPRNIYSKDLRLVQDVGEPGVMPDTFNNKFGIIL